MEPFRIEEIDTPAGIYTVELHYDDDPQNPLTDYDTGVAAYVVGGWYGRDTLVDTLKNAGNAGDVLRALLNKYRDTDAIQRRFDKWSAIAGSDWTLVTGHDSASQSDSYHWYVLADNDWPDPVAGARAVMSDYGKYASGEVCGFVTKTPNGDVVESIWGFYDENDALTEGSSYARDNANDRLQAANLVGAGFISIV